MGRKKLSDGDVLKVREMLASGLSQKYIAEFFHVHSTTICDIHNGNRRGLVSRDDVNQSAGISFEINSVRSMVVPDFTDYAVSENGDVFTRKTGHWKRVKPITIDGGYKRVWLEQDGQRANRGVSRLVLECFVGPCPEGMEACHFPDRDTSNNRLDNLRWDTTANNAEDKRKHGTLLMGEQIASSKLLESEVREILFDPSSVSSYALAEKYCVQPRQIRRIRQRTRWAHIS